VSELAPKVDCGQIGLLGKIGPFGLEFVMVVERPRKSDKKESLVVGSSADILNWWAFNKYSAWKIGASENFSSLPMLRFFFFFFFFFKRVFSACLEIVRL
jgi:hypothetical protein